jgi:DNA helicase II / ATP-dependent DNA helicase PcrA
MWHIQRMSQQDAGLNPAQASGVRHGDGPLLILAGAGSGKTRVITHRIAHLLDRGVQPYRILAVTFTNKAAGEMRERVARLVGDRAQGMRVGTFHATCAFILRQNAEAAGLPRDFTIFDDDDQKKLVIRVMKEIGLTDRTSPRQILSAIDGAKNRGLGPEDYVGDDYFTDIVARAYPVYQERLEQSGGVDFGDLLWKTLRLCRHAEVGPHLARRWHHVLVDEFQDTNRVQYELVRHLSSQAGNLCVVGDDDQSIYAWRGADVRNILDFERDHPGAAVVKLEQNYRSTQVILDAANAVIAKNWDRKDKRLFTEKAGGEPILYMTAEDERQEARLVVATIRKLEHDEGRLPDDFAVFYRTHAQSRALEEALRAADLAYTIVGGVRFFDRAEIKDLLGYLRVIANPADEISLERIINRPARGIGEATFDKVVEAARRAGTSALEAMHAIVRNGGGEVGPGPRRKLAQFVALIDELRAAQLPVSALADVVLEKSGYLDALSQSGDHEDEARIENLMELVGAIRDFEAERARTGEPAGLVDYLELVSLVSPADEKQKGITLMTVHAAKGLEFPVVFVTGLEDGVFPSLRNGEDVQAIAEERRLAYVSITRARERLFLTNARFRRLFGREAAPFRESRFIADIPDECIARPVERRPVSTRPAWFDGRDRPRSATPAPITITRDRGISVEYDEGYTRRHDDEVGARFRLGQRVRHARFGEGEVRALSGGGDDLKLTVYFPSFGPKTVIARFVEVV